MNIALCYENVVPSRGGCETYIADLARRLLADRHEVHLYVCRWDAAALPAAIQYHALPRVQGLRFLRPWRFGRMCLEALAHTRHDVSVGFDKTWGQDVLYPQGGLHAATTAHNRLKFAHRWTRALVRGFKWFEPAHWSFTRLERRQYLTTPPPRIVVNSHMVREHFERYLGISGSEVRVVRSAIDPNRFVEQDRPRRRVEWRQRWDLGPHDVVALMAAMNYRLKGLEPLLYSVRRLLDRPELRGAAPSFRLLVAGNRHIQAWERLAQRLRLDGHVRFVGHCPDMRNAYFAADFLVHPTFYDPCSLVVLEALACALPVITTRYNGVSELLHPPEEGYVVADPHDHAHLAWCMAQLLDPQRRAACAHAARRTAAAWTFEHHYRQLLDVFTEAAARKQAA